MGKILGIDFGKRKIGLARSEGSIAEPYKVIRFTSEGEAIDKVKKVVQSEQATEVVMGISEGQMAKESRMFGEKLKKILKIPIEFQDETLTTHEAQGLALEAGVRRKKRRALEDAYSASLILQAYLDLQNSV